MTVRGTRRRRGTRSSTAATDGASSRETRPRQYAARILELATRAERSAALDQVPEHLRALVATHVRNEFERRARLRAGQ